MSIEYKKAVLIRGDDGQQVTIDDRDLRFIAKEFGYDLDELDEYETEGPSEPLPKAGPTVSFKRGISEPPHNAPSIGSIIFVDSPTPGADRIGAAVVALEGPELEFHYYFTGPVDPLGLGARGKRSVRIPRDWAIKELLKGGES